MPFSSIFVVISSSAQTNGHVDESTRILFVVAVTRIACGVHTKAPAYIFVPKKILRDRSAWMLCMTTERQLFRAKQRHAQHCHHMHEILSSVLYVLHNLGSSFVFNLGRPRQQNLCAPCEKAWCAHTITCTRIPAWTRANSA